VICDGVDPTAVGVDVATRRRRDARAEATDDGARIDGRRRARRTRASDARGPAGGERVRRLNLIFGLDWAR